MGVRPLPLFSAHVLRYRQTYGEYRSPANSRTGYADGATVHLGEMFCECQSQPDASLGPIKRLRTLHEELEDATDVFGRDSLTFILHLENGVAALDTDSNLYAAAASGELLRVIQQVCQNLLDSRAVGVDPCRCEVTFRVRCALRARR